MHYLQMIAKLKQWQAEVPDIVGNEMVNYAQDNIRKESFEGAKWPPRKAGSPRNEGRGLLKDTGDGERSIRVSARGENYAEVDANEYMEAHNIGAKISGTFTVRSHTRTRNGRSMTVSAHSRTVNTKLPQRTFLAPSKELNKRIITAIVKRFKTLIG